MKLFSSMFQKKSENPVDVKKSILSFCYGNMLALSNGNIQAFIETFEKNPSRALKARLFSAGLTRAGVSIDQHNLPDIEAKFIRANHYNNILLFDFYAYGGVFDIEPGTPAIAPSFVGIVYNRDLTGSPSIFLLEPSFEPGSVMLINLLEDGSRLNLGSATANNEKSFIDDIRNTLNSAVDNHGSDSSFKLAESIFTEESGINIDNMPKGELVREKLSSLGSDLTLNSQISLLYRLVVMNYLAASKIIQDSGQTVKMDDVYWLTELHNRAIDYSEKADDHIELEQIASSLNSNIMRFFAHFGIRNG